MSAFMVISIRAGSESVRTVTITTLVGSLPTVHAEMLLQVAFLVESLAAFDVGNWIEP